MKREDLSHIESVADLFKVATARTRRRLVRREDPVDWELLSQILTVEYQHPEEEWPADPLDALILTVLAGLRPGQDCLALLRQLFERAGGTWVSLLDPSTTGDRFGLSDAELGHLRTVLRFVVMRFNSLTLEPLREFTDDRALHELALLPGLDLSLACTLLLRSFGRQMLPPTRPVRQVLTRMGTLPAGMTDTENLDQLRRIPVGVPIESLLQGLTMMARETCHESSPSCSTCVVVKLCDRGRKTLWRGPASNSMTLVDLFAGAGGMSLGLTQSGFVPALAVELDEWACETYRANHPELPREHVLAGDISAIDPELGRLVLGGARPDVVVGGPPCQGFSLIGKRGRTQTRFIDDPRNRLYKEYVRWIAALHPRLIVMENVPGLYSYGEGAIRRDIELNLNELGYAVDDLVLDTSRFGIPQRRQRVIFFGASVSDYGDLANTIVRRVTGLLRDRTEDSVSLFEAIADLPPLESGAGKEASIVRAAERRSAYAQEMGAGQGKVLLHHVARPTNLRDKLLYARLKPGETAGDAVEQGARHLMVYRNDVFHDKYRRLRYDEPSPTIMSHLAKDGHMFIHPDPKQRRSLTVREAARVQSFPDDFLFLGPRTAQFTQVGNAVPPKLARAIGEAIMQALAEVVR